MYEDLKVTKFDCTNRREPACFLVSKLKRLKSSGLGVYPLNAFIANYANAT